MRKDVILGMTIGGVMLAVIIVYLTISTSGKHNKHPVDTGSQVADGTGGPGDNPGQGGDGAAGNGAEHKADLPSANGHEVAVVKPQILMPGIEDKKDPLWGPRLWPNSTPLLVSHTPEPGEAVGGGDLPPPTAIPVTFPTKPIVRIAPLEKGGTPVPEGVMPPRADATPPSAPSTPSSPSTRPAGKFTRHTIQKGETFTSIAAVVYGSPNFYPYLLRANPKIDATKLKPNMEIIVPDVSEVIPPEKPAAKIGDTSGEKTADAGTASHKKEPTIDPKTEYAVQSGDSLHKISIKLYNKVDMVEKIYDLNKTLIGDNPAKLKLGTVLKLPAEPTVKQ